MQVIVCLLHAHDRPELRPCTTGAVSDFFCRFIVVFVFLNSIAIYFTVSCTEFVFHTELI